MTLRWLYALLCAGGFLLLGAPQGGWQLWFAVVTSVLLVAVATAQTVASRQAALALLLAAGALALGAAPVRAEWHFGLGLFGARQPSPRVVTVPAAALQFQAVSAMSAPCAACALPVPAAPAPQAFYYAPAPALTYTVTAAPPAAVQAVVQAAPAQPLPVPVQVPMQIQAAPAPPAALRYWLLQQDAAGALSLVPLAQRP
jgi:hypothetical protein